MSETRILKEIEEIYRDPPDFISAGPIIGQDGKEDIYHWEATIYAPEDCDYKGGVFLLDIKIPKDYPFEGPKVKFKTKIYHPNISAYDGEICVNILDKDKWNPSLTISNILISILVLLYEPYDPSPKNAEAAKYHSQKNPEYLKKVQEWIKEYSGKETFAA